MFKLHLYTLAGLALALNPLQAYDKDLETLYPESTMLYGRVDNITKLSKIDKDHPISNLIKNKAFKSYLFGGIDEESDETELQKEMLLFLTKHCRERASLGLLGVGIGMDNNETTNSKDSQQVKVGFNLSNLNGGITVDCSATQEELEALLKFAKETNGELQDFIKKYNIGNASAVKRGLDSLQKKEMIMHNTGVETPYYEVYDKFLMRWMQLNY